MRRWGIKKRVLFLALAPALVTGLALGAYLALETAHGREVTQAARPLVFLLGLLLICLIGAGALALRLGREITAPIGRLAKAVEALGQGQLQVRVPTDSGGELATLEHGINDMAARLEESQRELQQRIATATADLQRQKDEAERANLAKTRFLAAASHDLRQPMHALTLFVTDLKQRISYPEVSRIVENVELSVNSMLKLFNALLDISRLDAGVMQANLVDFPLRNLFDRLRVEFSQQAEHANLCLTIKDSKQWVRADPLLLERVLMNLISNAIRYTPRGGIVVGCRNARAAVRIEVWDSGQGIPAEQQSDIFQEFFQLGNTERNRDKGLGLGLAIVERMAKLLGTHVLVRSRVGKGSVFSIVIARGEARNTEPERRGSPVRAVASLEGARVVVIDDEMPILEGMRGLLKGWGCQVIVAENKRSALQQLEDSQSVPQVILSDYRLREEETGIDVIRAIRERFGAGIPGVLVTGDTGPDRLREAEASGFHLVHKPVRPAKLRALVTHLLARESAERAVA